RMERPLGTRKKEPALRLSQSSYNQPKRPARRPAACRLPPHRKGELMTTPDPAAPPLTLQLFGPITIRFADATPLPPLRTRKALWLLALLTLRNERAVDRSWLAGTLWPESGEGQAA